MWTHTNQSGIGNFWRFPLIRKVEICVHKNQMQREKHEIDFHWRLTVWIWLHKMPSDRRCCCCCCCQMRAYIYVFDCKLCATEAIENQRKQQRHKHVYRNENENKNQIYARNQRIKGENADWLMCPVKGRKLVNFL